jgi:hypothetical protein
MFKTYFVETHEWNIDTGFLTLMEYFRYDSGVHIGKCYSEIESPVHHTILSLQVF